VANYPIANLVEILQGGVRMMDCKKWRILNCSVKRQKKSVCVVSFLRPCVKSVNCLSQHSSSRILRILPVRIAKSINTNLEFNFFTTLQEKIIVLLYKEG
jgi:hypothetical protein